MMHIIPQTREEKIAMYMKLNKKELAEMICNCNEMIDFFIRNPSSEKKTETLDVTNIGPIMWTGYNLYQDH